MDERGTRPAALGRAHRPRATRSSATSSSRCSRSRSSRSRSSGSCRSSPRLNLGIRPKSARVRLLYAHVRSRRRARRDHGRHGARAPRQGGAAAAGVHRVRGGARRVRRCCAATAPRSRSSRLLGYVYFLVDHVLVDRAAAAPRRRRAGAGHGAVDHGLRRHGPARCAGRRPVRRPTHSTRGAARRRRLGVVLAVWSNARSLRRERRRSDV